MQSDGRDGHPLQATADGQAESAPSQQVGETAQTNDLDIFSDEDVSDEQGKRDERMQRALMRDGEHRSERDLTVIFEALTHMRDEFITMLSDPIKKALCSRFTLEEFGVGDRIFDYGSFGDKLYLIWTGRVSIEIPRHHESAQRQKSEHVELIPLTRLDPGRAFGELALISENKIRAARVTAVKKSLLLVLTRADYEWGVGMAQGSFVKDRVNYLRSVDRSVLEDISEVDLRAMAGHLRLESHLGDHTILTQGNEVDRIIFVKSGFCKVIRQLHPRFKKAFDVHSEQGKPPPNPFAVEEEPTVLLPKCGNLPAESVDEALALDLGLGGRQALRKLMSTYNEGDDQRQKSPASCTPLRPTRRQSAAAAENESAAVDAAVGIGGSAENMVVVDVLRAGMSFGVMEMIEGFAYQSSVVANPCAEVYVITKYDLIRNTSKKILHKLFCDYKTRLTDERLMQRLKQKRRWNNYKRDLYDEIHQRKTINQQATIDRRPVNRRTGACDLSIEDYRRVGKGKILWDSRAQTPPKPTYNDEGDKQYTFHVNVYKTPGRQTPQVVVDHDARDASLVAMEEKILTTIAAARFRDEFRRNGAETEPNQLGLTAGQEEMEEDGEQVAMLPALGPKESTSKHARPTTTDKKMPVAPRSNAVHLEQELDERAQGAAAEYLHRRKNHISNLQKAGKERASGQRSNKRSSTRSSMTRSSTVHRSSMTRSSSTTHRSSMTQRSSMMQRSSVAHRPSMIPKDPSLRKCEGDINC